MFRHKYTGARTLERNSMILWRRKMQFILLFLRHSFAMFSIGSLKLVTMLNMTPVPDRPASFDGIVYLPAPENDYI